LNNPVQFYAKNVIYFNYKRKRRIYQYQNSKVVCFALKEICGNFLLSDYDKSVMNNLKVNPANIVTSEKMSRRTNI